MRVEICGDMEVPCFLTVKNVASSILVRDNYYLFHIAGLIGEVEVNIAERNESPDLKIYCSVTMSKMVGVNGFAASAQVTLCLENESVCEENVENGSLTYCCSCGGSSDVSGLISWESGSSSGCLNASLVLQWLTVVAVPYHPHFWGVYLPVGCPHCLYLEVL